jgi:potassium-transporting ATPase KdpC subunit
MSTTQSLLRPIFVFLILFALLTGLLYPLAITGIAQVLFPAKANSSLITQEGVVIGSALIGQTFSDPADFWGRPSATSGVLYQAAASSGSNLGPTSVLLYDQVVERTALLRAGAGDATAPIPVDLVTASASGLDPHISPAAAYYQVSRVAHARGLDESALRELVATHIEGYQLSILGQPRVNVLRLNLALDQLTHP